MYIERDGGGDIHAYTCVYTFKRHICLKGFSLLVEFISWQKRHSQQQSLRKIYHCSLKSLVHAHNLTTEQSEK